MAPMPHLSNHLNYRAYINHELLKRPHLRSGRVTPTTRHILNARSTDTLQTLHGLPFEREQYGHVVYSIYVFVKIFI